MNSVFIAFGANLGKPAETFARALQSLEARAGRVARRSSLWQSPAWPKGSGAPDYVNAVVEIETDLKPADLLRLLHDIEREHGRLRTSPNAPRSLDLDIIAYGQVIVDSAQMAVPHPRMHLRGFVLLPLQEIVPDFRHPVTGETLDSMMAKLPSDDILAHRRLGPMLAFGGDSH